MSMTIDWARCVHIDRTIDDELVKDLIPAILALRQKSGSAITLGLNSPGGSVSLLPMIRSLARAENQDGSICELVTVATHRAYSAAAMLLAMGDYAVALPHAEVLFHDVRYGSVRDVTPDTAMRAAESLEAGNDRASLQMADYMFSRWMWMYLDIHERLPALRAEEPGRATRFEDALRHLNLPISEYVTLDLIGLMLFINKHLRAVNECILLNALERLVRWGAVSGIADRPSFRVPGARKVGTLDSLAQIYREAFPKAELFGGKANEADLNIFSVVLALNLSGRTAKEAVGVALREMNLFSSMNSPRHWGTAMKLMLRHKYSFFKYSIVEGWEKLSDVERDKIALEASPIVRAIWLLCVQVARELFSGEHRLQPGEAMVLGLIDEVCGGGPFQSRRQFDRASAA